jgi:hypothetical protein
MVGLIIDENGVNLDSGDVVRLMLSYNISKLLKLSSAGLNEQNIVTHTLKALSATWGIAVAGL